MEIMEIFDRLGKRWAVRPAILKDIYLMMRHDVRFLSIRNGGGIRYKAMETHIRERYSIDTVSERQLRYLVRKVNEQP